MNDELGVLVLADGPSALDGFLLRVRVDGSPLGSIALDVPPAIRVGYHVVLGSLHGRGIPPVRFGDDADIPPPRPAVNKKFNYLLVKNLTLC